MEYTHVALQKEKRSPVGLLVDTSQRQRNKWLTTYDKMATKIMKYHTAIFNRVATFLRNEIP